MPFYKGSSIYDTPRKARIKGAIDFCDWRRLPYYKTDVFRFNGVSRQRGYEIISQDNPEADRTHHNSKISPEKRGRPPLLSSKDIERCDRFLQDLGWDARLNFDVAGNTLKEAIGSMDYHKCIACTKGWVSKRTAKTRHEWATNMLAAYLEAIMWHRVRFSDEMRIIRQPGERYCADCIQHTLNRDDEKALEKDSILKPIVKPWIDRGDDFVLEEDNDSGHSTGQRNIVRTWKEKNGLNYYFNCPSSPDLSPIENCWQPPKQFLKRYPYWDEFETQELVLEGWENISQAFINERVNSMPQRLRDCIEMEGEITGY
ncbi:hypothetical protein CC80DRAFT_523056 [Byssothecium circinans]|uniref:Tc1-like transposase DDE domain-containing protein n=1 Tax=Byssothecium circinans TaxID=147558 RepID=A0A6A5UCU6_9PLEO|nr:hypothetical protein CC80DRAFT_523056 [Byssothecium circinans]